MRPLYEFCSFSAGINIWRQILTSNVDPRTERVNDCAYLHLVGHCRRHPLRGPTLKSNQSLRPLVLRYRSPALRRPVRAFEIWCARPGPRPQRLRVIKGRARILKQWACVNTGIALQLDRPPPPPRPPGDAEKVLSMNAGVQSREAVTKRAGGGLVQWLKLPAWRVGDQNVSSPLIRNDSILRSSSSTEW